MEEETVQVGVRRQREEAVRIDSARRYRQEASASEPARCIHTTEVPHFTDCNPFHPISPRFTPFHPISQRIPKDDQR